MTVQIDVDEKQWAEVEAIAKELNVDCKEMFVNTLRSNLFSLRAARLKTMTTAEKDRLDRESYERHPITEEERQEQLEWEEIQDWGDE